MDFMSEPLTETSYDDFSFDHNPSETSTYSGLYEGKPSFPRLIAGVQDGRRPNHLRYAGLHRAIQSDLFETIVLRDTALMQVLRLCRSLDLPNWKLLADGLCDSVWQALDEVALAPCERRYSISYYDPTCSLEEMDAIRSKVKAAFIGVCMDVQVYNTAYDAGASYSSVGVCLTHNNYLDVDAPRGLNDLFAFVWRGNDRAAAMKARWPKLVCLPQ